MSNKKTTKKENFITLKVILDMEAANHPKHDELIEFLNKEIAALEKKAADAKARAEKNRAAGDQLKEEIFMALHEEDFLTTTEIVKLVDNAALTPQKATARLTQLVEAGAVEKEEVKRPDPSNAEKTVKRMGYRRIAEVPEI